MYVRDADGELVFHALPTPTRVEVADIARGPVRIEQTLQKQGRSLDPVRDSAAEVRGVNVHA